jgi:hypothetical protein
MAACAFAAAKMWRTSWTFRLRFAWQPSIVTCMVRARRVLLFYLLIVV